MIVILFFAYMDSKLHLDLEVLFSQQGNYLFTPKKRGTNVINAINS